MRDYIIYIIIMLITYQIIKNYINKLITLGKNALIRNVSKAQFTLA